MEATMEKKAGRKLYILGEAEFCKVFNLKPGCRVPLSTRKQYSMYVKGSYLMHSELYNYTDKKPMSMEFQGKRELIKAYVSDNRSGWQTWIQPLGSVMRMECSYIDKNRDGSTPFWTYTKFNNDVRQAAAMAYNKLSSELMRMRSEYNYKYRIEMTWRNMFDKYGDLHGPIWLDGCDFMNKLEVKGPDGLYAYLSDYEIKRTIHNRHDIWVGDMLDPVKKIVKSFTDKK